MRKNTRHFSPASLAFLQFDTILESVCINFIYTAAYGYDLQALAICKRLFPNKFYIVGNFHLLQTTVRKSLFAYAGEPFGQFYILHI